MYKFLIAFILLLCMQCQTILDAQNARSLFYDSLRTELSNPRMNIDRISMLGELAYHLRNSKPDSSMLLAREALSMAYTLDTDRIDNIFRIIGLAHYAQKNQDSSKWYLERSLEMANKSGDLETESNSLNNLGIIYKLQDEPEKALTYFQKSLRIKTKIEDKTGRISAINYIGNTHLDIGNYTEAEKYYKEAFEILKEGEGSKRVQAVILSNMGLVASHQGKKEKTLDLYRMALKLREEIGDELEEAHLLSKIAKVHKEQGRFSESLDKYLQSLDIRKKKGNQRLINQSYYSLGSLYKDNHDHFTALSYFQKSRKLSEEIDHKRMLVDVLNAIGSIYQLQGDCPKALPYYFQSLALREEMGQKTHKSSSLSKIGICYEQLNKLDSSLFYLQKALDISKESRLEDIKISTHIALGKVYEKRGEAALAINHLEKAFDFSSQAGLKQNTSEVLKILYQTHKNQGNYKDALIYLEKHKVLQDSLFNEANTRELIRVESKFKFEKEKQAQAAQILQVNNELEKEKLLQRIFMFGLIIVFVLMLAAYRYYQLKKHANVELLKLNEEISAQKATVEAQKKRLQELDLVKSHFFTNISHEFRTPLTIIKGMCSHLQENPQKWLQKGSQMIIRNADNLLNLVNQILDLRKLESGNLKLHLIQGDIVYYLKYVTESFQSMVESKKLDLIFTTEKERFFMDYDPEKITRICSNLLSNAIKFTPEGGKVQVNLAIEDRRNSDTPSKEAHPLDVSRMLILSISDTGIGISTQKLPYIFDRFYQVDGASTKTKEGTGVGLALTKEMVKLMGGNIEVESTEGVSTIFTLTLPITQEAPMESINQEAVGIAHTPVPGLLTSHKELKGLRPEDQVPRLLIVEDNADIVNYLTACLEDQYTLFIAKDGKEGREIALKEIPDLIVSDVMMPHMDGFELCYSLKTDLRTSHIPIILLTAKANTESRLEGLRQGADAYLAKPFNKEELFIRLEKLLELRRNLQKRYSQVTPVQASYAKKERTQEDAFISNIKQLIKDNLKEESYGVQELCRDMGMSRSNLHRKIKALTGNSISIYMRRVRLHQAKKLLLETQLTISEIAYDVGFNDPKYFTRSFKKEFTHTPSQIRLSS